MVHLDGNVPSFNVHGDCHALLGYRPGPYEVMKPDILAPIILWMVDHQLLALNILEHLHQVLHLQGTLPACQMCLPSCKSCLVTSEKSPLTKLRFAQPSGTQGWPSVSP